MDKTIFSDTRTRIECYVASNRLKDAFETVASLAAGLSNRKIGNEIAAAEQSYHYMLDYAMQGADDPGRAEMARDLGARIFALTDRLEREYLSRDTPSLYYSTLRYEATQQQDSIPSLLEAYREATAEGSMFNFVVSGAHSEKLRERLAERERLERRIFNRVWTVHPLSGAQTEALANALADASLPPEFRILLAWAITLGGLHYYDEHRLQLLLDCYADTLRPDSNGALPEGAVERLSAAAIVGALLLMHRGRRRGFSPKTLTRIDVLLSDGHTLESDIRTCYLEFAKTIDTDRISRKITDEIVPEMLKLKPQIDKQMKQGNLESLDPEEIEENPEWREMLENSGLADKIKEMSEIQEEGGDVMMGTFAHLKTFPFFNDPYGWFLPFHTDFSEFAGDGAALYQSMADIIAKAPFLCDSDKFSFMLSLKQVPQAQRDMMMQQFRAQGDQLAEIQAASLSVREPRSNAINKTVQNAFRFFRLFRRKGEFFNPFSAGVNLVEIDALKPVVIRMDIMPLVGEFYFSHGYYPQAIDAFKAMAADSSFAPDDQFYQKLGYAYQKSDDTSEAIRCYLRAEMLNSGSDWTLTRLAHLLLADGQPAEALKRYLELERRKPGKAATAIAIGRCHLALGDNDRALQAFFKAEYLGGKPEKTLRPLAWTLLISHDFERAHKYFEKVMLNLAPIADDYLNMGHLALAEGRLREALNFYSLNISMRTQAPATASSGEHPYNRRTAIDSLIADINQDLPTLTALGVDPTLVPLLIDSLLYSI